MCPGGLCFPLLDVFSFSSFVLCRNLHLPLVDAISSLDILSSMPEADREVERSTGPVLPVYREDVKDMMKRTGTGRRREEGIRGQEALTYVFDPWLLLVYALIQLRCSTSPDRQPAATSGLLRRCYGSMKKLVTFHSRRRDQDVEAALIDGDRSVEGTVTEPRVPLPQSSHNMHGADSHSHVHRDESHYSAAATGAPSPALESLAAFSIRSNSIPRLLSDEDNARMDRKVDRLIAAIDERRPIHFEPDARTGEVEIFANRNDADEMTHQGGDEQLEPDISASPESFGRGIRSGNGVRRIRSLGSLPQVDSTGSWASTDSEASSSNAWERAVAAANERFAREYGDESEVNTAVRLRSRGTNMKFQGRSGRSVNRSVSPIPLNFDKPLRVSTPSIHSNGTEMDTSSPLFKSSCERILRESYTEAPDLSFRPEFPKDSLLDEWAFVSEPRDVASPKADVLEADCNTGRKFGVFRDDANGRSLSKKIGNTNLRSKVLKDISNLRRPGYLKFNSFAKDAKATADATGPTAASPITFEGAADPESRRAYIKKKWPELLENHDSNVTEAPSKLDGAARRRNEQAIGRPLDESLYSLSGADIAMADVPLNARKRRQTHFDLALARLEGRALPPPPSPIHRFPDSATLYDLDVHGGAGHRPLPIRGPRPSRTVDPTPRQGLWRHIR